MRTNKLTGLDKTTKLYSEDGYTCVKYHNTIVIRWNSDLICLNSGGYRTQTTNIKMNQASNQFDLGLNVFQEAGDWYVRLGGWGKSGYTVEFEDGMVIDRSGI